MFILMVKFRCKLFYNGDGCISSEAVPCHWFDVARFWKHFVVGFSGHASRATRSCSQISFVEERCHSLHAEMVKRNYSEACSSLSLPWLGRNFLSYWSFPLGRVSLVTATVLLSHVTCIESISDRLSGRNHFYLQLKM